MQNATSPHAKMDAVKVLMPIGENSRMLQLPSTCSKSKELKVVIEESFSDMFASSQADFFLQMKDEEQVHIWMSHQKIAFQTLGLS